MKQIIHCIENNKLEKYSNRYDEIINVEYEQNKLTKSKVYKKEKLKLLKGLKKYVDNHLMFIFDFYMPFDNNLSERDLRHVKTKQKISSSFNSLNGLQNYLNIKSIIIICKKQGIDYYNVIKNIFENKLVKI
ncbi:MAG: transposase [Clostridia bacterium]